MKLPEKIRNLRQEKGISLKDLQQIIKEVFGEKAVKYNTLWRIEQGLTRARASSLHQICIGLGMTLRELKEGTEEAPVSQLAEVIKKAHRLDRYAYNNQVYADMLTRERHFSAVELVLESGGKTRVEEDPLEIGKFEKWVYCLTGSFTCVIGQEVHTLQKGDCLSFQSNIPHSFQNDSSRQTRAIVIQSPKYI